MPPIDDTRLERLITALEGMAATGGPGATAAPGADDRASRATDHLRIVEEIADIEAEASERQQRDLTAREEEVKLARERLTTLKRRLRTQRDISAEDEANLIRAVEELDLARKTNEEYEKRAEALQGMITQFTGLSMNFWETNLGKLARGPIEKLTGDFGKLNFVNKLGVQAFGAMMQQTMEFAVAQDEAMVAVNRATGAVGQFDGGIQSLSSSMRFTGVSASDLAGTYTDLFNEVSDFTEMTEEEQMMLAETTSVLGKMGISAKDTAANIQLATKGLGMSVDQAEYLVRELKTFAKELGVATSKMASDFARMAPMIAELGSAGPQAFRNLQREAKATGITIDRLYQITSKYDTFAGAAESVGKLNAMLGGPFLNTMEMVMEEDPAERMRMLKESVDDAGLSFDTMSKYQRKALAEAMGLNNASELALVLRGREDMLDPTKGLSAETIEENAQQLQDFNAIMGELKQIAMALAINLGPLVKWFKIGLDYLGPWIPAILTFGSAVGFAMGLMAGWPAIIMGVVGAIALLAQYWEDISEWWYTGKSPSGVDTFGDMEEAFKGQVEHIGKATIEVEKHGEESARTGKKLQESGIVQTVRATGAKTATASPAGAKATADRPIVVRGDVILDGRKIGEIVNSAMGDVHTGLIGKLVGA